MLLVVGILGALFERSRSGLGQVVDAAMIDGVALLTTIFHGMMAEGLWPDVPGSHVLQLAAPFYNVYETADGRHVTVGAGEPQFYAWLVELVGADELASQQGDPGSWPDGKERLAAIFKTKTRDEWCELLDGTDTCFAPVLAVGEAREHPQLVAAATYVDVDGVGAAGLGAAVQPDAGRRRRFARGHRPAHHRRAARLGLHPRRDRRAARGRRGSAGRIMTSGHDQCDATRPSASRPR